MPWVHPSHCVHVFLSSLVRYVKFSASEKHITALSMEPGDVLLVDNYRALHGRDVFQGDRFHAVSWFTWDDNEEWRGNERRIIEKNGLNKAINSMMDWLPKDFESNQS
jgi:hypothetical protein